MRPTDTLTPLNELDVRWVANTAQDLESPVLRNNMVDGQLYGIPVQADISGLWYRRDWFQSEGIEVPATWEAWLGVLDHFAQPDVRSRYGHQFSLVLPVTATTGEATVNLLYPFVWMVGGDLVSPDGTLTMGQNSDKLCEALAIPSDHHAGSPRLSATRRLPKQVVAPGTLLRAGRCPDGAWGFI